MVFGFYYLDTCVFKWACDFSSMCVSDQTSLRVAIWLLHREEPEAFVKYLDGHLDI